MHIYWKFGIVLTVFVALNQSAYAATAAVVVALEGTERSAGVGVASVVKGPDVAFSKEEFALAQLNRGWALETGRGVDIDLVEAAHWYQASGINGNPDAYFYLACLLAEDRIASDDPELTVAALYEKAAARGCAEAQFNLGLAYGKGREGVTQDYEMALKWFQAVGTNPTAKDELRAQALVGIKWAKQRQRAAAAAMTTASTSRPTIVTEEENKGEEKE